VAIPVLTEPGTHTVDVTWQAHRSDPIKPTLLDVQLENCELVLGRWLGSCRRHPRGEQASGRAV